MSTKHTKTTLEPLKRSALASICEALSLSTKGDKNDLMDRILILQNAGQPAPAKIAKKVAPKVSKKTAKKQSDDDDDDTDDDEDDDGDGKMQDVWSGVAAFLKIRRPILKKKNLSWSNGEILLTVPLWFCVFERDWGTSLTYEAVYEADTQLEGTLIIRLRRLLNSKFPMSTKPAIDNIIIAWTLALDMFIATKSRADSAKATIDWDRFFERNGAQLRAWQEQITSLTDEVIADRHGRETVTAMQAQRSVLTGDLPVGDTELLAKILRKQSVGEKRPRDVQISHQAGSPTNNKTCVWCGIAVTGKAQDFYRTHNDKCPKRNGRSVSN